MILINHLSKPIESKNRTDKFLKKMNIEELTCIDLDNWNPNDHENWVRSFLCLDKIELKGEKVKVAVIDSGYDPCIPELGNVDPKNTVDFTTEKSLEIMMEMRDWSAIDKMRYLNGQHMLDIVSNDSTENFHGSNMAAAIGGSNGVIPECELYILKINDSCPLFPCEESTANAIIWCVLNNIDIVNISRKTTNCSVDLHEAVKLAYTENTILVCAAGNIKNNAPYSIEYPAAFQKTFAIGAFTRKLELHRGTARGSLLDFVVPGKSVPSFISGGLVQENTSIACAIATGIMGLLIDRFKKNNLEVSYHNLKMKLIQSTVKLQSHSVEWGYGVLHPEKM